MVSVPVWLWQADLQASITLVIGVLLSYAREFGLVLTGMSMWLDRQLYNAPSIPTLQVLHTPLKAAWHYVRCPLAWHLLHKAFSLHSKSAASNSSAHI